jgi:hypothetical protein
MSVVVIGTFIPSAIGAKYLRFQVIRSEQAEWEVVKGFIGVFAVIPVLEFSKCEIFSLLIS